MRFKFVDHCLCWMAYFFYVNGCICQTYWSKDIFYIEVLFLCYLKEFLQELHTDDLLIKQSWTLKKKQLQHLFEYRVLANCLIYWKWALDNHDSLSQMFKNLRNEC